MAKAKTKGPRPRRIPQRTCVACRQTSGKRDLIRVVRTAASAVEVDLTGRKAGRGAYLCASRACWERALSRNLLEHALKTTLSDEDRARLLAFAETLPSEASATAEQEPASSTPAVEQP